MAGRSPPESDISSPDASGRDCDVMVRSTSRKRHGGSRNGSTKQDDQVEVRYRRCSRAARGALSTPVAYGVEVKAANANGGRVYVGLSAAVTANSADGTDGFELSAGETVFLPLAMVPGGDVANVWVIASASGQKVFWEAA